MEIADTLSAGGTFVARQGRQIVATLTVSDMGPMKRNVLLDAPRAIKGSLALLRFATTPLPGFIVPGSATPYGFSVCVMPRAMRATKRRSQLCFGWRARKPCAADLRVWPSGCMSMTVWEVWSVESLDSRLRPWLLPPAWGAPDV